MACWRSNRSQVRLWQSLPTAVWMQHSPSARSDRSAPPRTSERSIPTSIQNSAARNLGTISIRTSPPHPVRDRNIVSNRSSATYTYARPIDILTKSFLLLSKHEGLRKTCHLRQVFIFYASEKTHCKRFSEG